MYFVNILFFSPAAVLPSDRAFELLLLYDAIRVEKMVKLLKCLRLTHLFSNGAFHKVQAPVMLFPEGIFI